MRDKLIRLQKLYIDQFQRQQYCLREDRRAYCHNVRKEKEEQLMSIHSQPKDTAEEVAAYEAIKALNHYNRPQGVEAVLQAQLLEKRHRAAAATGGAVSVMASAPAPEDNPTAMKCTFNLTTNTKCGDACIPMAKHCMKHILNDQNQVLFRTCGITTTADDGPCETPVPDLFESSTCVFHTQLNTSICLVSSV